MRSYFISTCVFVSVFLIACINSDAQQIRLQPLSPVPEISIEDIFVSPANDIYLETNAGIHYSSDDGQTWNKVELPVAEVPTEVFFLDSGQAIVRSWTEAFLEENGQWIQLNSQDTLDRLIISTFRDEVIRKINDKIYASDKYGNNLREIILPGNGYDILDIYSNSNVIHLISRSQITNGFAALIYDDTYNLISIVELPAYDLHDNKSYLLNDDVIVTYAFSKTYISVDKGISFTEAPMYKAPRTRMIYGSGKLYYVNGDSRPSSWYFGIHSIDVANININWIDTLHSFTQPISMAVDANENLHIHSLHQFAKTTLSSSITPTFIEPAIRTRFAQLEKFMTKGGKYYGMTKRFVYASSDKGQSWERKGPDIEGTIIDYDVNELGEILVNVSERYWIADATYRIRTDGTITREIDCLAKSHIYCTTDPDLQIAINPTNCSDVGGSICQDGSNYTLGENDCMYLRDDPLTKDGSVYLTNPGWSYQNGRILSIIDRWNRTHIDFVAPQLPGWLPTTSTISPEEVLYVMGNDKLCISNDLGQSYQIFDLDTLNSRSKNLLTYRAWDDRLFMMQIPPEAAYRGYVRFQSTSDYAFDSLEFVGPQMYQVPSLLTFDEEGYLITTAIDGLDHGLHRGMPELPVLTSNAEVSESEILLYPNPAHSSVTLHLDSDDWTVLDIYNLQGKHLHTSKISGKHLEVDVTAYPEGLLYLTLTAEDGRIVTQPLSHIKR